MLPVKQEPVIMKNCYIKASHILLMQKEAVLGQTYVSFLTREQGTPIIIRTILFYENIRNCKRIACRYRTEYSK